MKTQSLKIGFIGAGNMGRSIIQGLAQGKSTHTVLVHDKHPSNLNDLLENQVISLVENNLELCLQADIVVIAVKPQAIQQTLLECHGFNQENPPVFISVAAGVTTSQIRKYLQLKETAPVVRVMPNTPSTIQLGMSGLFGENLTHEHKAIIEEIAGAIGAWVWIEEEKQMDLVTALSGSGPAYFFYFCEQLISAAQKLGLSKDIATQLTLNTCIGASSLAKQASVDLQTLREQVTSPGGTTQAGLSVLQSVDLDQTMLNVLKAAATRGKELSEQLNM